MIEIVLCGKLKDVSAYFKSLEDRIAKDAVTIEKKFQSIKDGKERCLKNIQENATEISECSRRQDNEISLNDFKFEDLSERGSRMNKRIDQLKKASKSI